MSSPKAPVLDAAGARTRDASLDADVFGAEVKPHLVHEAVRAELNAARSGTRSAKSRGLVAGGRAKPWRQKGTGRARAGTIRAPQFTGGGVAFPPTPRNFGVKVNRKARRSAYRSALTSHAAAGTLGVLEGSAFAETPSTKAAVALLAAWGQATPLVLVASEAESTLAKSFRNIERVAVVSPSELDVAAIVWARSLLVSEAALPAVQALGGAARVEEVPA
ncbi:MAG: 50S ribosomal protein L4 [Gaiellaceae bacterium]